MPTLPNPKWELFAQALAKGAPTEQAYEDAGYKPNRGNAGRLKASEGIRARVGELLGMKAEQTQRFEMKAVEKIALTKKWVIDTLIENVNRAMQTSERRDSNGQSTGDYVYQGNVANKALELLGKELGMFIDRKEVGGPGEFDGMEKDELRRSIASDLASLGEKSAALARLGGTGKANGSGRPH